MNAKEVTSHRRFQPRRLCTSVQAGPEALNRMVLDRDNQIDALKKQLKDTKENLEEERRENFQLREHIQAIQAADQEAREAEERAEESRKRLRNLIMEEIEEGTPQNKSLK